MRTLGMSLAVVLFLIAPDPDAAGPIVSQPHVKVRLVADATGISPGGKVGLAVAFTIDKDWHIYWVDHGGSAGLPTEVLWQVPVGWSVGRLRFPSPTSHTDDMGEASYILEGAPALVTELTAPADARPGGEVSISADASWLVCKDECIRGQARLTLTLPVVSPDKAAPANESLFRKARRALPVAASEAKYVRITIETDPAEPPPGSRFKTRVHLDVESGMHLQSAKPTVEGLVGTELFVAAPSGVQVDAPRYPPGKERVVPELGKLSEYSGRVSIEFEGEVLADIDQSPVELYGVLRYQACDDKGACFPPAALEFTAPLRIAGLSPVAARDGRREAAADSTAGVADGARGASAGSRLLAWTNRVTERLGAYGLAGHLLLALIGGFILNFMPCVLPVISIKILSFVRQAHEDRLRILVLGAAFSLGIVVSFAALGGLIIGLESQWGGLFQRPHFVIGMAAVVTAFALSLFGVFTLNPPRAVNELGAKVQGEGLTSAFGTGLLATALGTACTAPFLSAVIAVAVKQGSAGGMAIFLAAGFGMALPYLVLTAQPAWVRFVPRPGPWMAAFEHLVGFALLATVVWLLNPLASQIGAAGLLWTLVFLLFVAAGAWLLGKRTYDQPLAWRAAIYAGALTAVALGWLVCFRGATTIDSLIAAQRDTQRSAVSTFDPLAFKWENPGAIPWVPYTRAAAERAVRDGFTVFVDYTADWCVNCKANERLVLETDPVRREMRRLGVLPFKADYTLEDPEIKEDLARHGRSGVPMYLVIAAGQPDQARVLPELLTVDTVVEALKAAGPSRQSRTAERPERDSDGRS